LLLVRDYPIGQLVLYEKDFGWAFLEALYGSGSMWRVGFDGADWWSGRAGCYPTGDEHVVEEKR
jgi:hypothetical protein